MNKTAGRVAQDPRVPSSVAAQRIPGEGGSVIPRRSDDGRTAATTMTGAARPSLPTRTCRDRPRLKPGQSQPILSKRNRFRLRLRYLRTRSHNHSKGLREPTLLRLRRCRRKRHNRRRPVPRNRSRINHAGLHFPMRSSDGKLFHRIGKDSRDIGSGNCSRTADELSRDPLNQQMARQINDLSAAGANLFHAVVELQRLRQSSERKFQRWFFDTRDEQERAREGPSRARETAESAGVLNKLMPYLCDRRRKTERRKSEELG